MNILANLRSAFTKNQRRNVIVASAAALVVAAVVGRAAAINLTIDVPRTYQSIVEIATAVNGTQIVYSVASNNQLIMTDIVIGNSQTTAHTIQFYQGSPSC